MTVKLRYKAPDGDTSKQITETVQDQNISITEAPESMRFATAVAEFGMLLRNSSFKGDSSFEQAKSLAKGAKGEDDDGIRAEFINLIDTSSLIQR